MRGRRRVGYRSTSVLGSVVNAERFCLGVATSIVGPLSERERSLTIALSHTLSGLKLDDEATIADLRDQIDELQDLNAHLTLSLYRCLGGDAGEAG